MHVRKSDIFILFICVFIFISGCASSRTLGNIPTESADFLLSVNDLKNGYPEIIVYERDSIEKPFGYCTRINDLINAWGEPDEKENDWRFHRITAGAILVGSLAGGGPVGAAVGTGIVLTMVPTPMQFYSWHKGNYQIIAHVDTSIFCGYSKRLVSWKWVNNSNLPVKNIHSYIEERN